MVVAPEQLPQLLRVPGRVVLEVAVELFGGELETFSKLQGDRAGALTQNLKAVNRERYDYTECPRRTGGCGD